MITMSDAAATKLTELLSDEPGENWFRVFVKGGGCSGYSYGMLIESVGPTEDDTEVILHGHPILIDSQSAPLLVGSEIDYSDSLQGAGFKITNPQAKTTCGCGSSFGT